MLREHRGRTIRTKLRELACSITSMSRWKESKRAKQSFSTDKNWTSRSRASRLWRLMAIWLTSKKRWTRMICWHGRNMTTISIRWFQAFQARSALQMCANQNMAVRLTRLASHLHSWMRIRSGLKNKDCNSTVSIQTLDQQLKATLQSLVVLKILKLYSQTIEQHHSMKRACLKGLLRIKATRSQSKRVTTWQMIRLEPIAIQ